MGASSGIGIGGGGIGGSEYAKVLEVLEVVLRAWDTVNLCRGKARMRAAIAFHLYQTAKVS